MNDNLKKLMLEAGYAAPELAGRAKKFTELFLEDIIKNMTKLDYHGEWLGSELKKHYGLEEDV